MSFLKYAVFGLMLIIVIHLGVELFVFFQTRNKDVKKDQEIELQKADNVTIQKSDNMTHKASYPNVVIIEQDDEVDMA